MNTEQAVRRAMTQYFIQFFNKYKNDLKLPWQGIMRLSGNKGGTTNIKLLVDGSKLLTSMRIGMANSFFDEYFVNVAGVLERQLPSRDELTVPLP